MRIAVIVGAGATLAEALPSRPSQRECPPLDGSFFELCHRRSLPGLPTVKQYLDANYGIDLEASRYGMEEIFNIIYSDALSADGPDGSVDAYWLLLKMYREAIRATTNELTGTSRDGVGGLLRFMNRREPDVRIEFVTFNHDLVIENAIHAALGTNRYDHIPFDISLAYYIEEFEGVVGRRGGERFRSNHTGRASYAVLKLHGSLNWAYTVRSADDAKNALRNPGGRLYCVDDTTIGLQIKLAGGARSQDLLPLVVPPIYEKSSAIQDTLRPVWSAAREAIERADEIVIFGYSFPDVDVAARNMLRRAFHANEAVRRVSIIDVSPEVAARIGSWINCPSFSFYRCVRDFVRLWPIGA